MVATTNPGVQKPHCWASCVDEGLHDRSQRITFSETFDGGDLLTLGIDREYGTGVDDFAVHQHRASSADATVADALSAGEVEVVAQGIQQCDPWLQLGASASSH